MKNKKFEIKPVPYEVILANIKEDLESIEQWLELESYGNTLKYATSARRLIELLEVHNCGSIGGFDVIGKKHQEDMPEFHDSLKGRYAWLEARMNNTL